MARIALGESASAFLQAAQPEKRTSGLRWVSAGALCAKAAAYPLIAHSAVGLVSTSATAGPATPGQRWPVPQPRILLLDEPAELSAGLIRSGVLCER
jgi:hypothetical protein